MSGKRPLPKVRQAKPGTCGVASWDLLDIVTLWGGLSRDNPHRGNVAAAMGFVGAATLADIWCAALVSQH